MLIENPCIPLVDKVSMLPQIIVKVSLLDLLRIPEHKDKALTWVGSVRENVDLNCNSNESSKEKKEPIEMEGVVSQIPLMYLNDSVNWCLQNADPFLLSIIINGKTLKHYMIDSSASNTIMPFEVMEKLGLKVDTTQGRFCAMD